MKQIYLKQNLFPYTKVSRIITFLVCVYIFVSFFEGYINALIGPYNKFLIIFIIGGLFLNNNIYRIKWYHISFSLWILIKFISVLWSRDLTMMRENILTQVSMFLLFILMSSTNYHHRFIKSLYNSLWLSSALMGLLGLFFSSPYLYEFHTTRQVLTILGVQIDPNYLAANYLVAIALSLSNIFYYKKYMLVSIIIFIINSYSIAITGSRGGLLTYSLILLLVIIVYTSSDFFSLSSFYKIIILLSIITTIFFIFINYLPPNIFDRLFNFKSYGQGAGRLPLWLNAFRLYLWYPLFGSGWGSYYGYNDVYQVIHNTFLLILVEGGIIGFLLYFVPIIKLIIKALKLHYLPIVLILVAAFGPSLFLDALDFRFLWNALILSYVLYNGEPINIKLKEEISLTNIKTALNQHNNPNFKKRNFLTVLELKQLFKSRAGAVMKPLILLTFDELKNVFGYITSSNHPQVNLRLFELQSCFGYGNYFSSREDEKLTLDTLQSFFEVNHL